MVEIGFSEENKSEADSRRSINISGLNAKLPCETSEGRNTLASFLRELCGTVQSSYHEDIVELNFIQSGSILVEFYEWRRRNTQELMQALCSGHLDPEDLALVSGFMSGHISSDAVFPPCGAVHPSLCPQSTQDHDSEDEDDEVSSNFC
ncbi:unnamed protein product [Trichobilharzia regenti]|nr:unnamed protein product [Trichobilharzia regenti]